MIMLGTQLDTLLQLMQDISEVRRFNLLLHRKMAEKAFYEDPKNHGVRYYDSMFAKYIGISVSFYSQLKSNSKKKNFSYKTARAIEIKTRMDTGWYDIDHSGADYKTVTLSGLQCKLGITQLNKFLANTDIKIDESNFEQIVEKLILHLSVNQNVTDDDFYLFLKK